MTDVLLVCKLTLFTRAEAQESWYEKLNRWDEALDAYERKYAATASNPRAPAHIDATLGRLRCLAALAEWNKLSNVARDEWRRNDPHVQVRNANFVAVTTRRSRTCRQVMLLALRAQKLSLLLSTCAEEEAFCMR